MRTNLEQVQHGWRSEHLGYAAPHVDVVGQRVASRGPDAQAGVGVSVVVVVGVVVVVAVAVVVVAAAAVAFAAADDDVVAVAIWLLCSALSLSSLWL